MIITIVNYLILLAFMFWGCKFSGFKKNFNDDYLSLDVTKSLRGLAAIGVLIHHISQEQPFQNAKELAMFSNIGYMFVGIFFFCSGYGLIKSLESKPDYFKHFFRKRILTLVVPFYVMTVFYAVARAIAHDRMSIVHWICSMLGLTMMNPSCWFVIVLCILYVTFYFSFRKNKNRKLGFVIIAIVIALMGALFCFMGHFAWWTGPKNWWLSDYGWRNAKWWMQQSTTWFHGEWWVNSPIAFLVGLIYATYDKQITSWFKKLYWLKLVAMIILTFGFHSLALYCQGRFGFWSEFNGNGPGIGNKAICLVAQMIHVVFFVLTVITLMMKLHTVNPVTRWFGNISLETYLMQYIPLYIFRFIMYKGNNEINILKPFNYNLAIYEVVVLAATIGLAIFFKWINKLILKKIG